MAKFNPIDVYEEWFMLYPGESNPFDLNTREKYAFMMAFIEAQGTDGIRYAAVLLKRRKGTANNPAPWSKYEYWAEKYPMEKNHPGVPGETVACDSDRGYELYQEWFEAHPLIKSPTDIDMKIKYDFMKRIGWEDAVIMHKCRKQKNQEGKYHLWTKPEYWLEKREASSV